MQSRLIEDMLDLARIEQGKLVLSVGPTEMVRVVEAALEAVRPAAEPRACGCNRSSTRTRPSWATPTGCSRSSWNLLSNAIKFTPQGRPRAGARAPRAIGTSSSSSPTTDRGSIPPFLPHVFDRFRQADAKISAQVGRPRAGARDRALHRRASRRHGGRAERRRGRGATFTVRLPTAPLRADAAIASTPEPGRPARRRSSVLRPSPGSGSWWSTTSPKRASSCGTSSSNARAWSRSPKIRGRPSPQCRAAPSTC